MKMMIHTSLAFREEEAKKPHSLTFYAKDLVVVVVVLAFSTLNNLKNERHKFIAL